MKSLKFISIVSACLLAPFTASHAANFADAFTAATAEIDKANDLGYEWRDSRKLLEKAAKSNKDGDNEKAIKLVEQAKKQGQLAVKQAKLQSSVIGPR